MALLLTTEMERAFKQSPELRKLGLAAFGQTIRPAPPVRLRKVSPRTNSATIICVTEEEGVITNKHEKREGVVVPSSNPKPSATPTSSNCTSGSIEQQYSNAVPSEPLPPLFRPYLSGIGDAEKGIPVIESNKMKRVTLRKSTLPPKQSIEVEQEQGSSTGVNQYAEGHVETEKETEILLKQNLADAIKDEQLTPESPTDSQDELALSQEPTAVSEEGSQTNHGGMRCEDIIDEYDKHYKTYPHGFPSLAAFLNSAGNFSIARRFGRAHQRVLLHLTCEVTLLEKELDELDKADENTDTKWRLKRGEFYEGWDPKQKDLIEKLRVKLLQYDELVLKDSNLRSLAPALPRDHRSVFNWIRNEKPLDKDQYDFIYYRDDFVSLVNQPREGFDEAVKSLLNRSPSSRFQQLLRSNSNPQDPHTYFFSTQNITLFARILAVSVAITIILIPIFILFLAEMSRKTTSIMVLVFVLAFAALMSMTGTKAENVFVGLDVDVEKESQEHYVFGEYARCDCCRLEGLTHLDVS
ncbi:hypothetical protein G7Y89_g7598 [Cudoniella acicularis]|uniref:DUF6594 domain-containing protein n=1 Tax=Cudoniella acicularis TaxID=354080 RepID=A0A8H4RI87_9HELO|nr:hypothetical protein G7Y89_g7598 [Cudoniella acicularis]